MAAGEGIMERKELKGETYHLNFTGMDRKEKFSDCPIEWAEKTLELRGGFLFTGPNVHRRIEGITVNREQDVSEDEVGPDWALEMVFCGSNDLVQALYC